MLGGFHIFNNSNLNTMETTIRAAGYVRVSTSIQVTEGESLDTQRKQITEFIAQKGWTLTNIYADEGLSGAKQESRPQLQQLKADAKAGKFNIIVFTKLSRFARNAREYMNLSYELEQSGVQLASVKENIDPTTRTGKMIAGILALFAEWEHETIREQMFENKMIKWKENRSFLGKPPFGYTWNKEKKQLEVVPEEAEVYNRIVLMYTKQGMAMRDIAIKLNAEGLKCKRSVFASGTISYILKNPCYYGNYSVNTNIYVDGKRGAGTKRTKDKKPESEVISFPIPAIITKPEWDAIQEATKFKKIITKHSTETTMKFFLRNVLICDRCGARMNARIGSKRKDGSINRYYVCYFAGTSKKNIECGHDEKCDLPFINAEYLERTIWQDVERMFIFNPHKAYGNILNSEKNLEQVKQLEQTIQNLESERTAIGRTKDRLYKLLQLEDLDVDELHKKLRENKDQRLLNEGNLTTAKTKLQELTLLQNQQKEIAEFYDKNKKHFEELRKQITRLNPADKKTLVESMVREPVKVNYNPVDDPDDPAAPVLFYNLKFNPDIIQRFIDEGKINLTKPDLLKVRKI